jgi:hypothetical protein
MSRQSDTARYGCGDRKGNRRNQSGIKESDAPNVSTVDGTIYGTGLQAIEFDSYWDEDMCQSCVEIDKRVERLRELSRSTTDLAEIERVNRLISKLHADRVRLHQNPER